MRDEGARSRAVLGFTVKSGWASAVLIGGSPASPVVLDSRRVDLSDPAIAESRQPFHAAFGTARRAGPDLSRLVGSVKRFGRRRVTTLIREYQARHLLERAAVVAGSLIDPQRITNEHIRIHALEGQLFRGVLEDAAARNGLSCTVWRERDLYALAARVLKQSGPALRRTMAELGREVPGAWRVEQKAAALAAWLVLEGRAPRSSGS